MITVAQADALVREFYGEELKPLQLEIVAAVLSMDLKRVAILGATQIQKSRAVARGLGILAATGTGIVVVAPKLEQAITPLQYFIQLMNYNPFFQGRLLQGGEDKVQRLQQTESKTFLSFKGGGFIRALTVNEGNEDQRTKSLLGKGGQMIVFEEASLTSNETESGVLRMIAGWGEEGRIIKLGNAITREKGFEHFYNSTQGLEGYYSLIFDYKRAVAEGIYTQSFIDLVKTKPLFDQLYGCIFPEPSGLIQGGYKRLFDDKLLDAAIIPGRPEATRRPTVITIDVGEGKPDETVVTGWDDDAGWNMGRSENPDTMAQIGELLPLLEPHKETASIIVDSIGVGSGFTSRLMELGYSVSGVRAGEASPEKGYRDIKAYGYFEMQAWLVNGGKLYSEGAKWEQMKEVAWKTNSDKNVYIESKEELKARKVQSYNDAETGMLRFAKKVARYDSGQLSN